MITQNFHEHGKTEDLAQVMED